MHKYQQNLIFSGRESCDFQSIYSGCVFLMEKIYLIREWDLRIGKTGELLSLIRKPGGKTVFPLRWVQLKIGGCQG